MATFMYLIKDSKGIKVEGTVKAGTLDEAVTKLSKEGGTIISVKSAAEGAFKGKMSLFEKLMLVIYKLRTGISLRALVFFTRQLATMFSAGLTLEKAITNLEREEKNKRLKKIQKRVSDDIKRGFSLSEAMEQHPGVFNNLYIALVQSGEISGTLHTVLNDLSDYLEKIEDTRRKVISAMAYPFFILCFLILVVWGLFYFVIPMFTEVYGRFGADLPAPTLIAMSISEIVRNNVIATFIIVLLFVFFIFLISLTDRGRYFFHSIAFKMPVAGNLLKNSIISKFARTFSILMAAGVPIMDTMELTENIVQNAVFEAAIRKARVMVKEGHTVVGAFRKTHVFPSTLLQLIATGEETGDMDKLLAKAAEFYEKLVDSVIERLTSLIEPILIVIMAGVVGTIIVVVYLPVFYLGLAITRGHN